MGNKEEVSLKGILGSSCLGFQKFKLAFRSVGQIPYEVSAVSEATVQCAPAKLGQLCSTLSEASEQSSRALPTLRTLQSSNQKASNALMMLLNTTERVTGY